MAVELNVLGEIEVWIDGRRVDIGHARQRCVLAALLVEVNRPVPVDAVVDRVWGDRPPQRVMATLHSYLSRLRRALTGDGLALAREAGGYILCVDPAAVDLHRFRALTAQARAAGEDRAFDEALALWRGEPFGAADTPWLNSVRESLHAERWAAELDRNDAALANGRHADLLGRLGAAVAAYPLDERLGGQLMLALYRSGRQSDALGAYRRIRVRLTEELGADPSPPLRALHQRILTADTGLAAPGRVRVPRQLPAPPQSFAGRARELAELDHLLDRAGAVVISAIGGAGGMGKTWLASRWAHDNVERFPDGQLYVNLRGFDPSNEPVLPSIAVRGFLDALGVPPAVVPPDPDAQAALYRSLVVGKRMLIVLDNARDSRQVAPLLPGSPGCAVLVTSRHQLAGLVSAHGAQPLALDVLGDAEAQHVLGRHLGAVADAEPAAVTSLLESCAGLPLALGIVAARAALNPGLPLAVLAKELHEASTRLDALDAGELTVNLRAVLSCSEAALSPAAARAFMLLGLAPGPDIGLSAVASLVGLPAPHARPVLRELIGAHLIAEPVSGRYRMHDLVRLYATERAHALEGGDGAIRRVLDYYLHTAATAALLLDPLRDPISLTPLAEAVAPDELADEAQALSWFKAEHRTLLGALSLAQGAGFDGHTWRLVWALVEFLSRGGHLDEWVAAQRLAVEAAHRLRDAGARADSHRNLGRALTQICRYDDAYPEYQRAQDLYSQLGDPVQLAHLHRSLAWTLGRQGRHRQALDNARQALNLFEASAHRRGRAYTLGIIGSNHARLGEYEAALRYCRQALDLLQEIGDPHGEAGTWSNLGYVNQQLGRTAEAVECYEHALELIRDTGDRDQEARMQTSLGDAQEAVGMLEPARGAWQRALEILTELGRGDADRVAERLARPPRRG